MKYAAALVAIAFLLLANLPREHASETDLAPALERLAQLEGRSNVERRELLHRWFVADGHDVMVRPMLETSTGLSDAANLIVTVGEGESDLVVGAHFDATHNGGRISGGIVDNGAATLVLLELAGALRDVRLRHRLRIVLFDREEIDQAGSREYAAAFGERTAAMLNLDVIGRGNTAIFGPTGMPRNAILAEAMQQACNAGHHSCMNFPRVPHSDDAAFSEAGVPVLSIGLLPRVEAHQFWLSLHGGDGSGLGAGSVPRTLQIVNSMDDRVEEVSESALDTAFCVLRDLILLLDERLT